MVEDQPAEGAETTLGSDPWLRCVRCEQPIARPDDRCAVGGLDQHHFANPHGLVREITLFAAASGVMDASEPTSDWTWFPGYAWTVIVCAGCHAHLGWRFEAAGDQTPIVFYGLLSAAVG